MCTYKPPRIIPKMYMNVVKNQAHKRLYYPCHFTCRCTEENEGFLDTYNNTFRLYVEMHENYTYYGEEHFTWVPDTI